MVATKWGDDPTEVLEFNPPSRYDDNTRSINKSTSCGSKFFRRFKIKSNILIVKKFFLK